MIRRIPFPSGRMPALIALAVMLCGSAVPATSVLCIAGDEHAEAESLFDPCCAPHDDHRDHGEHGDESLPGFAGGECSDCVDLLLDADAVKNKRSDFALCLYALPSVVSGIVNGGVHPLASCDDCSPPGVPSHLAIIGTVILLT